MMMLNPHPTVQIPFDPTLRIPYSDSDDESDSSPFDSFNCDDFRMYEFKVRRCVRGRSHDWMECPFAHPGEKARRRDPRKYHYSGASCPEFRRGSCRKGDACEFAHGVFECWLHPARYRTEPCKDGRDCKRKICFFAHSPEQLRIVTPHQQTLDLDVSRLCGGSMESNLFYLKANGGVGAVASPTSILEEFSPSPPMSPVAELVNGMRGMRVGSVSPRAWGYASTLRSGGGGSGVFGTQPSRVMTRCGLGLRGEAWDAAACEEEPVMERVESGRDLRARIYARLNNKGRELDRDESGSNQPDLAWVSDLIK